MNRNVVVATNLTVVGDHKRRRCVGGWPNRWLTLTTVSDDWNNNRSKICVDNGSSNRSSWFGSNRS